jgi:hypothetical protein
MTPSHIHMHLLELFRAGFFEIRTVGEPGIHGAVVTGMHGCGVRTPIAAAVAAITWGLVGDEHMPKGRIFFMGILSMIVAADILLALVRFSGVNTRLLGATPKLQASIAPITTNCPIFYPLQKAIPSIN